MNFPSKLVENAVEQFASLPGIGRKSALRVSFTYAKKRQIESREFWKCIYQIN